MERLVIVGCGSSTILKAEDTGPLEVTSRLGAGRFGEVFAAACRHQPHFALKAILKQPMADFEQEAKAPKELRGAEQIMQLHEVVESNEELVLLLEHCLGRNLQAGCLKSRLPCSLCGS